MYKIIYAIIAALCLFSYSAIFADVPSLMNYQGRMTDAEDAPLNTVVSVTFTIYDDSVSGDSKWSELQPAVSVIQGLFNVELGSVNPIPDTVFNAPNRYLGMKVGEDPEIIPRTRLVTSAYAYKAIHADTAAYASMSDDGDWETDGIDIWRMSGAVGINISDPWAQVTLGSSSTASVGLALQHNENTFKDISFYTNDIRDWVIRGYAGDVQNGALLIWTPTGKSIWFSNTKIGVGRNNPSATLDINGSIGTRGINDNYNVVISNVSGDENKGSIAVVNESNSTRAMMAVHSDGDGIVYVDGANGNSNVVMESLGGYPNNGHVYVADASGVNQAGLYVNSSGNGVVYGDTKSFKMENPDQPGTDIWYTCPEGPEAAAYIRGTGRMIDGKSTVLFPEHFKAVISEKGMTVNLTPLSAESRGLAVTYKGLDRIEVTEMGGGVGSYDFDYLIMAVRKGYEDYEVIRSSFNTKIVQKAREETNMPNTSE